MITTRLLGRAGNNMFQISAMIGYARKHCIQYHVPKTTVAPNLWPNHFEYLHNPMQSMLKSPVFIKEKQHYYQELPVPDPELDYVMEGYWQSYLYFDFCIDEIRNVFGFNYEPINSVAIHVRRGDYVTDFPDKHPTITEEYLDKAIYYISFKAHNNVIFFSDDIEWCKDYASKRKNINCMFSEGHSAMEDFSLMVRCSNFIISNSSFSWFAAYLAVNPNKTVVTPHEDNWMGINNKHLDVRDLIPKEWHRIKY